jgi:hypothetical protein
LGKVFSSSSIALSNFAFIFSACFDSILDHFLFFS